MEVDLGMCSFMGLAHSLKTHSGCFLSGTEGMSFHGGLIGVVCAFFYFAKQTNRSFFEVSDFLAPMVPIGLGAVRFSNFINQELFGRVASPDLPWAMIFPDVDSNPRHPSQLYEMLLEGVVLFIVLWWFSSKPRPVGVVTGLFGLGYGASRFFVEFFRQPDEHIQFVAFGWLTMGQLLSTPMIILGAAFIVWGYKNHSLPSPTTKGVKG